MWHTMPNDLKKAHACRGMLEFKYNPHGIATIEVTGYIYDRHYLLHKCYPSITVKLVLHPDLEAASIEWLWKYLQYLDNTVSIGRTWLPTTQAENHCNSSTSGSWLNDCNSLNTPAA
jgi:hypothetical protein